MVSGNTDKSYQRFDGPNSQLEIGLILSIKYWNDPIATIRADAKDIISINRKESDLPYTKEPDLSLSALDILSGERR